MLRKKRNEIEKPEETEIPREKKKGLCCVAQGESLGDGECVVAAAAY
jgi:hypothetical protein